MPISLTLRSMALSATFISVLKDLNTKVVNGKATESSKKIPSKMDQWSYQELGQQSMPFANLKLLDSDLKKLQGPVFAW
jgi:hypothetical protein